ncbi:MAG: tripartite tricarboxylate transporter TctB family protein [Desulfitobacterium hafniense]|nr:tripartite tricarboxylate transporter TctB family protein [Desulfitobacterium hafniense]
MSTNGTQQQISVYKKTDFKVGLFFLIFSVFVISAAGNMPKEMPGVSFGPGVMPYWLGIAMAILSVLLIIQSFSKKNKDVPEFSKEEVIGVGGIFLLLLIYMGAMDYIGFALDTFLLVTIISRKLGKYAYWKCALLGALTGGITVYFFRILLDMPLPIGLLGF